MTSPLAGSLAATIGKAFQPIFLPATLTRGATPYPCKAIFEKWGENVGARYVQSANEFTILVLAWRLPVIPNVGDVISLQGTVAIVVSNSSKPAISRDPAIAVWTLLCKLQAINVSDYPRVISITRPGSTSTAGLVGYQGATIAGETPLISGIRCSILIESAGKTGLGGALPDDSPRVNWTILVPLNGLVTLPLIKEEDRIYDDLGRRYEVSAYEPQALSAKIEAVRLKS